MASISSDSAHQASGQRRELFVLGATGYVGSELVRAALERGHGVKALVRAAADGERLARLGVEVVSGDAADLAQVIGRVRGVHAVVDLLQPRLPNRFTEKAAERMSVYRQGLTDRLLAALRTLPAAARPLLFSVSGVEDLEPDGQGRIGSQSKPRATATGFGRIGIPVSRLVDASGIDAVHVHFGTVYGPGKAFADKIIPGVAKGRMPVVGDGRNRAPLTSVVDAARAIVHLAELPREAVKGARFLVTDGTSTTQREFLDLIAASLGARRPMAIPAWLARLAIGSVMVVVLMADALVDNSKLLTTGFRLLHPSPRDGVGPMLEKLGYRVHGASDPGTADVRPAT